MMAGFERKESKVSVGWVCFFFFLAAWKLIHCNNAATIIAFMQL